MQENLVGYQTAENKRNNRARYAELEAHLADKQNTTGETHTKLGEKHRQEFVKCY